MLPENFWEHFQCGVSTLLGFAVDFDQVQTAIKAGLEEHRLAIRPLPCIAVRRIEHVLKNGLCLLLRLRLDPQAGDQRAVEQVLVLVVSWRPVAGRPVRWGSAAATAPLAQVPEPVARVALPDAVLIFNVPELSVRARNALQAAGFSTLQAAAKGLTLKKLRVLPNIGEKSAGEIEAVLIQYGLALAEGSP